MRLLRFQRKLDDEKGAGLLGLSLQVKGACHMYKVAGLLLNKGAGLTVSLVSRPPWRLCWLWVSTNRRSSSTETSEFLTRGETANCAVIGWLHEAVLTLTASWAVIGWRVPLSLRYWWLKLKSLAEKEEWEELEKFSKSKKSPIGYLVRGSPAQPVNPRNTQLK